MQFPIELNGKAVNTVQALWTKNKNEMTDDDYEEFYKYVGHDSEPPQYRLHFSADAPLSIRALLFVPQKNHELSHMSRGEPEVHLYCRKDAHPGEGEGPLPRVAALPPRRGR